MPEKSPAEDLVCAGAASVFLTAGLLWVYAPHGPDEEVMPVAPELDAAVACYLMTC